MTSRQKMHIARLLKGYATERSKDTLIGLVAETSGMLTICSALLAGVYENRGGIRDWLREECDSCKLDLQLFLHELAQVVELFNSDPDQDGRYAMLGVAPGASAQVLKQAYRRMSKKYHPDTAVGENREAPEKFIEITKIYKELLAELEGGGYAGARNGNRFGSNEQPGWQQKVRSMMLRRRRVYGWTLAVILCLCLVFVLISLNHRKRMMIAGLHQSRDGAVAAVQNIPEPAQRVSDPDQDLVQDYHEGDTSSESDGILKEEPDPVDEIIMEENSLSGQQMSEREYPDAQPFIPAESIELQETTEAQGSVAMAEVQHIKGSRGKKILAVMRENQVPRSSSRIAVQASPSEQNAVKSLKTDLTAANDDVNRSSMAENGELLIRPSAAISAMAPSNHQSEIWERIDRFIDIYTWAYEQRDIDMFSALYTSSARENGEQFSEMHDTYSHLFSVTSELSLRLDGTSAVKTTEGLVLDGRFKVYWHYRDSGLMFGTGTINMKLVEEQGALKVQEVEYRFDH